MSAADGTDLFSLMIQAIDRINREPFQVELTYYAAGPNSEAVARKLLPPGIPIVRMDKLC